MNGVMLSAFLAFRAVAPGDTGMDLLSACTGKGMAHELSVKLGSSESLGFFDEYACMEYISGIIDAVVVHQGMRLGPALFCFPEGGTSREQQVRIVVKHLEENPKDLHAKRRTLVVRAFAKAFPCEDTVKLLKERYRSR